VSNDTTSEDSTADLPSEVDMVTTATDTDMDTATDTGMDTATDTGMVMADLITDVDIYI
jgi:hypothetical protein